MQNGSTAKEAKRLYNIDTEEGLNRVLQEELIGVTKNNDPRLIKGKIGISKGLEQLRQADNMRTMGAEIAQTGLSLIKPGTSTKRLASEFLANAPERQFRRQLATSGVNKALGKALNNKAGRFVIKAESKLGQLGERAAAKSDKYINSFESSQFGKGYAQGVAVSDMLGGGLAGDAILGVAGGAARKAAVTLKDAAPQALKDGIEMLANAAKDKYTVLAAKIGATRAGKAAKKFLDSNAGEFTKLMAKYGVTTARKSLAERMSEGDEELAQYMNSKKDFANTYGYQSGDLVDLMTNDFKMIEPITKFYASYFGLANSELMNDAEAVSNWQGGFALGGMHPVAMAHFGHAVKDTYQQVSVRDAILNSTMFNREADKINRASDEVLVDQIARGRGDQVMSQLSRLQKRDKNSKEPQFGDEFWDEKRQDVDRIQRLVKDRRINKMLEAIGITKGTKAYNVAIADQANLRKELDEVQTAQQEKKNDITQMYSSKEMNDEVDKIVDEVMNYKAAENATADAALKQDSKVEYLKDHELGEDATEEDRKKLQDDAEKYANAAVEQANQAKRENIRNNIFGISHTVNKLKALIDLKARMNTADDIFNFYKEKFGISVFRPDAKRLLSNIDKQIQQAKYELQSFDKKYDAKSDDVATMTYLDDHVSDVIGFNSEEIQDAERHSAMLSANESILNGQIASLSNDLVLNDEGQYEFNPEEAKYNKKQQRL
jgi:hypothetical protein